MAEPVSLVLEFLRQHNFGKAEEALRLELQARHLFARPAHSHDKVELTSHTGGFTAHEDCHRNALVDKTTYQESQRKPDFDAPERGATGEMHQMHASTEWEFKSCSNHDCVLEFKKQDARPRMPSLEVSSIHNKEVKQNGMVAVNSIHYENGIGRRTGHVYESRDFILNSDDGSFIGPALSQTLQHDCEITCNHSSNMKACKSNQLQQDLGALKIDCTYMHEPKEVLQKAVYEVKAFSPQSNVQNFASSANNSFMANSWLDHGVQDDDNFNSCKFTQPALHPLPTNEGFEQQEEKRVVHDCIDFFKALALETQTYPADLFKDISFPWEVGLQNCFMEEKLPNERQIEDYYNVPSSNLRPTNGNFNITKGISDSFGLDKLHTNALFEPSFNLGSFLDIPVGQEIASPGEKHENGVCQLSYSMQDTPELLSGFATLGDEPTDPGMGYPKEYWDSDMYEDDEDPGYERREIEDEDWFLAHEIVYPHEDDKVKMVKEKMRDYISNEGSEMVQGKEVYTGDTGGPDVHQAKLGPDISSITALLGCPSADDALTLRQIGNISYDGHLMDAEELKLMRLEPVWQGFSSQMEKHVHHDKEDGDEAYDKPCGDYPRETDLRTDIQMKKAAQGSKWRRDSLHENCVRSDHAFDQIMHDNQVMHNVEAIRNFESIPNQLKLGFTFGADKEGIEYSHFSEDVDALSCSATFDMKGNNGCKSVPTGYHFNSPASNQDSNAVNSDAGCPAWSRGIIPLSQERQAETLMPEDNSTLWKQESCELSPVSTSENGKSSNPALFSHSKVFNHLSCNNNHHEARDDGTAYDSAVNEMAVDDGDSSALQEEAQLVKTEEDEYEVFNLRIVHRKNRTGFEEEKYFQVVLNSVVAGRYLIMEYLGSAAFSKAVQARDLQTGMDVCMKIIKNNKDFFDQSLDEIKLLKYINKNDPADKHHLLRLYDYFYHREHLFIVCELLRANLYEFHKFNRESGGEAYFTMSRLQSITRQCLEALEFLHCLGLIHCDLKPENILIKSYSRCEIKVIDLGSSCFQSDHLCSYVQSRSYRAPEVILGLPYDQKIDIWSLGCILAELCSGNVLFQNDSLATLLARVVGIIEPIMPDMISKGKEAHKYFTKNAMLYERNQDTNKLEYLLPKRSSLRHRLATGDQGFVDFVGYLLQVNPDNRPSASEALKHPWLTHPYEARC